LGLVGGRADDSRAAAAVGNRLPVSIDPGWPFAHVNLKPDKFHGEWNYTMLPSNKYRL